MNTTKRAIFITIYKIIVKGKKHYIEPSVNTIIDLLCSYHSTEIKRRWAFQCLHDLEEMGYINRRERYIKTPDGLWKQIPSLITITLAGARKLYTQGVDGAARLIKEILGWVRSGDKRWPGYKSNLVTSPERMVPAGIAALGEVIASLDFMAEAVPG
ncbi:hypothetical protein D4R52_01660 [bacterium]|nr:MAG: hypothetical protein D4R52_01660 [bacterium]